MDTFYIIKVVNPRNESGYIIDSPDGVMLSLDSLDGLTADVAQFPKYTDAQKFITDHNLEANGCRAYIKSSDTVIRENPAGISKAEGDMFYVANIFGEKCFYNTKMQGYYFDKRDVGYCCWKTAEDANVFIRAMEFDIPAFVHLIKSKK